MCVQQTEFVGKRARFVVAWPLHALPAEKAPARSAGRAAAGCHGIGVKHAACSHDKPTKCVASELISLDREVPLTFRDALRRGHLGGGGAVGAGAAGVGGAGAAAVGSRGGGGGRGRRGGTSRAGARGHLGVRDGGDEGVDGDEGEGETIADDEARWIHYSQSRRGAARKADAAERRPAASPRLSASSSSASLPWRVSLTPWRTTTEVDRRCAGADRTAGGSRREEEEEEDVLVVVVVVADPLLLLRGNGDVGRFRLGLGLLRVVAAGLLPGVGDVVVGGVVGTLRAAGPDWLSLAGPMSVDESSADNVGRESAAGQKPPRCLTACLRRTDSV